MCKVSFLLQDVNARGPDGPAPGHGLTSLAGARLEVFTDQPADEDDALPLDGARRLVITDRLGKALNELLHDGVHRGAVGE